MKKQLLALIMLLLAVTGAFAQPCTPTQFTDFTSFSTGTVNYQGPGCTIVTGLGYTIPNPYGSLWTVADEWGFTSPFDEGVKNDGTGNMVWRLSNAYTSGSYSSQPNSPSSPLPAGESTAALYNDRGPNHTTPISPPLPRATAATKYFHGGFKFKSATGTAQPGLFISINPIPRQTSYRMSYVGIQDVGTGFNLIFYETTPGGNFPSTTIATNLSYTSWHQVDIYIEFVDGLNLGGSGNDIVKVGLNGALIHTGTTWESYFAETPASFPSPIAVDALMFRSAGTAVPGTTGNGLYFDDVAYNNAQAFFINLGPSTNAVCGTPGSAVVSFSGGTGPYDLDWHEATIGSPVFHAYNVTSPYTVNGLTPGFWYITVKDALANNVTTNGPSIGFMPVSIGTAGYATIQAAVTAAAPGDVINVCAGTYDEMVVLDKPVTLRGANAGIHPAVGTHPTETVGIRGAETILSHNGLYAFSPAADDITIDGFKFTGQGGRLIDTYADANGFHLTNCIFAVTNVSSGTGMIQFGGGSHTDMLLDFNLFKDKSEHTIYTGGGPFTNFTVQYNKFQSYSNSIFWTASALSGGIINHNEFDGESGYNSNDINIGQGGNLQLTNNWFHDNSYTAVQCGIIGGSITGNKFERSYVYPGYRAYALQLWGGAWGTAISANVTIENNEIHYNDVPGALEVTHGIQLNAPENTGDPSIDASTIHIHNNAFYDGGVNPAAWTIRHRGDQSTSADATCNWYASDATPLVYQAPTFAGPVAYLPHLYSGTDVSAVIGFQTNEVCTAPCALVISVTSTPATCPSFNNGTATVSVVSGGTGSYSYLWSPGGQITATATGLTAGNYTVVVTDVNGCSASAGTTVATYLAPFTLSGTIKYANNAATPLNGILVTLKYSPGGATVATYNTNTTPGSYSFTGLTNNTYDIELSSYPGGSWTTWGGVNNTDYLLVLKHTTPGGPFLPATPPVIQIAADVVAPYSTINTLDASAVRLAAANPATGYTNFTIPKWVFSGPTAAEPLTGIVLNCANFTRNILGLCAGDVNKSYLPPSGPKSAAMPNLELINRGSIAAASEITVPVKADLDMELGAITLFLDYDASQLEITGVTMAKQGNDAPWFLTENNVLQIGWVSLNPMQVAQGETVFTIHARAKSATSGLIRFTLNSNPLSELANGEGVVLKDARLAIADIGGTSSSDMISVYPNPAKDVLNIEYVMDEAGTFRAELRSVQGVIVGMTGNTSKPAGTNQERLSVNNLPSGVYMLRVYRGETINTQKIIINR